MLARRYRDEAAVAAYDPVNEFHRWPLDQAGVLRVYRQVIGQIRAVDPERIILVQPSYGDTSVAGNLAQPSDLGGGSNLVWSLHDYFAGGDDDGYDRDGAQAGAYTWDGTTGYRIPDATALERHLLVHLEKARAAGLPVWIGEFGIGERAVNRSRWIEDQIRLFDRYGLGRAWWQYAGSGPLLCHKCRWVVEALDTGTATPISLRGNGTDNVLSYADIRTSIWAYQRFSQIEPGLSVFRIGNLARVSGIWGGSRMGSLWPRAPRRWAVGITGAIAAILALASAMAGASVLVGPSSSPPVVARCDVRTLGTLGGLFGNAMAVNRHGVAVGIADDAHGVAQPVIWRETTPERLTTGLARSIPRAVNAPGQVVGTGVQAGASSPSGWVWSQGRTTPLSVRDHRIARPEAINDRGVVVGALSPDEGPSEEAEEPGEDENDWAAMWPSPSSKPVVLSPLQGDQGANAFAVDANGRIGGTSQGVTTRPVIWDRPDHPRALPTLGGGYGIVRALGDNGVAVGDAVRADGGYHAVLWDAAGRITDLGLPAGARSAKAEAILPNGVITGTAELPRADGWHTQAVQWTGPGAVQALPSTTETGAAANAAQALPVAGYRADGAGGRHPTLWRCGR